MTERPTPSRTCRRRSPSSRTRRTASSLIAGRPSAALSREELTAFLKKRRGVLQGVCVTGGEPLVRKKDL
ncbi:MAG: hypothetical protein KHZ98_02345, partial [Actinomyces sp.]|nr:hypothetical protein [Actinomyces sp.]